MVKSRRSKPARTAAPSPGAIPAVTDWGRRFWLGWALAALLVIVPQGYKMTRPFCGLHSWAAANGAWQARAHVHYGLGYTKGVRTMAVGTPPTTDPQRYLNHPQLATLLNAACMLVLGVHEWTLEAVTLLLTLAGLALLAGLLRRHLGDGPALLTVVLLAAFPITGYFGLSGWLTPVLLWALLRYLALIDALPGAAAPVRRGRYLLELAVALFLAIQISWLGFFYAFVIGAHYLLRCLRRRQKPAGALLTVLVLAPLLSMAANFAVMLIGFDGDVDKIVALYRWRSAKGERASFSWAAWLAKIGEFALTNFTWPALLLAGLFVGYRLVGRAWERAGRERPDAPSRLRPLPLWWFFLLPGMLHLLTFKGLVWEHQYWQRSFSVFVALAAAGGALLIHDLVRRLWRARAAAVVLAAVVLVVLGFCGRGVADYLGQKWQSQRTLALFQKLNGMIPPDKALLTFKDFGIEQHESKGKFYRPEYAWYLDREMIPARTPGEVEAAIATGRYPVYYVPDRVQPIGGWFPTAADQRQLAALSDAQLMERIAQSQNRSDGQAMLLRWEFTERLRRLVIDMMKRRYAYEYFEADANDPCPRGNVPAYLFLLDQPRDTAPATPAAN